MWNQRRMDRCNEITAEAAAETTPDRLMVAIQGQYMLSLLRLSPAFIDDESLAENRTGGLAHLKTTSYRTLSDGVLSPSDRHNVIASSP